MPQNEAFYFAAEIILRPNSADGSETGKRIPSVDCWHRR